jgi:hypothetical protein
VSVDHPANLISCCGLPVLITRVGKPSHWRVSLFLTGETLISCLVLTVTVQHERINRRESSVNYIRCQYIKGTTRSANRRSSPVHDLPRNTAMKSTLKFGVALLTSSLAPVLAVTEWGQCGGIGYSGSTACNSGLTCVVINDCMYSIICAWSIT